MSSHMLAGRRVIMSDELSCKQKAAFLRYLDERYRNGPASIMERSGCSCDMPHVRQFGELYVCRSTVESKHMGMAADN